MNKSKGFHRKKLSSKLKRIKLLTKKYSSENNYFPNKDVEITCLNCKNKFIVAYKRRFNKFCCLGCSSSYNNKIMWVKRKEFTQKVKDDLK